MAKALLKEDPQTDKTFIKAALFHDIGKIVKPLNILEKSLAVLMNGLSFTKNLFAETQIMRSLREHGPRGEAILRERGFFEEAPLFYEVIGTHHEKEEKIRIRNNKDLTYYHHLLKKQDELY